MNVYITTKSYLIPDCPADLEVTDDATLGVSADEESAWTLAAESCAIIVAEREGECHPNDPIKGLDYAIETLDADGSRWTVQSFALDTGVVADDDLTDADRVVVYQLEKIDQGGAVTEMFEEQTYAVAERLTDEGVTAEIVADEDDPDYEAHGGEIRIAPGRFVSLVMRAVVVQD